METSNRRSYTKEQRVAAVADVPMLGVVEAAKKYGVPQSLLAAAARPRARSRLGTDGPRVRGGVAERAAGPSRAP
jgi:transposase-like protein